MVLVFFFFFFISRMKIEQRRTTAELSQLDMQTLVWRMLPVFPWSKLLAEHIVLMMNLETEHGLAKNSE